MAEPRIKIGDWVRLTARARRTTANPRSVGKAQVELFYDDIEGGVRLRTNLGGFVSWNVKDLVRHSRPKNVTLNRRGHLASSS